MHLRYYQQEAFNSCITHYNKGEQSAFLIMPTGSG
ncbi:DEAD/DEAH box helicase family protein, partial [Vibrio parahaemolyticus]|nr:DEAD/DEAH box helicase family protein [Vibrio parahaemolyticus]